MPTFDCFHTHTHVCVMTTAKDVVGGTGSVQTAQRHSEWAPGTGLLAVLSKSGLEPCVNRSTVSASDQHSTTRSTEKGMFARFYFPSVSTLILKSSHRKCRVQQHMKKSPEYFQLTCGNYAIKRALAASSSEIFTTKLVPGPKKRRPPFYTVIPKRWV